VYLIVIGLKTTQTACGETDCVFLGAALSLTELSTKRTGLALTNTTGYYTVLFTVETKKPTASYLK